MVRGSRTPLVALALVLATASCVGPFEQLEGQEFIPNYAANASKSGILVRDMYVVGPPAGERVGPGTALPVYMTVISQLGHDDRLVEVRAPGTFEGGEVNGGTMQVPPKGMAGGGPAPQARLTGLTRELRSGVYISVDLRFQRTGTIRVETPVLTPDDWRATLSPWPAAPAPPSPSPSPLPASPTPVAPTAPGGLTPTPTPS
ncbi:hypothetical protein SAMN04489764_0989 [Thermostaphylospora chromogena]|uniref:Copper(I)-binding protein n=2 Tax=Thermostaphylospora chromogena TaxID=35622 RepID=A0A1H1BIU4_9ACTN|nr:hypothetical protein SAMN04489764_0989 [Thermostaphylospora chromogena]